MDENKTNDIVQEEEQPVLEPENTNEEQAQQTEEAAEVSGEEVSAEEPSSSGSFIKKLFSRKNIKKTIAVILLVLIAGGGIYGASVYTSPESIALRFVENTANFKGDNPSDYYAYDYNMLQNYDLDDVRQSLDWKTFFEKKSSEYNYNISSWDDYYKADAYSRKEKFDELMGSSKYDVTCEVTRTVDIPKEEFSKKYYSIIYYLEELAFFDPDSVSEAKEITIKVKFESEEKGIRHFTYSVLMVKQSDSWKILTCDVDS